jgi:DUF2075 family protein
VLDVSLPVYFSSANVDVEELVTELCSGYASMYSEYPRAEQVNAWRGSLGALLKAFSELNVGYPIVAEYPIFNLERLDFLVVGKTRALVVECKGWKTHAKINDYSISVDGELQPDPCYQLKNYVNKLRYFHSASGETYFDGVVYTYNCHNYHDDCSVVSNPSDLAAKIELLGEPGQTGDVERIVEGQMAISSTLVDLVKKNRDRLLEGAAKVLVDQGYGLSNEQLELAEKVLASLEKKEDKTFLVKGESGSGKTLVAITLLLEAVARGHKALLAYRNNRLLNTLRTVLGTTIRGVDLSALLVFYSTGKPYLRGLGEPKFPVEKYGEIELAIYDEAQRMTEEVMFVSKTRSRIRVYFYDDRQILVGDEAGTRQNFIRNLGVVEEYSLSASFRAPQEYLKAVVNLLWGRGFRHKGYDFRVYDNIVNMLRELEAKKQQKYRVALISAFTESDGDRKKPKSLKNRRIGYPLQSGLSVYRNLGVDVYWLMDEKHEYPKYWIGRLNPLEYCASVYGAQGLEADYVGVVWGRDLVRRGQRWSVDFQAITDKVGGKLSLRSIAKKDQEKALNLLLNRYYVLLTRGIRGTYVFFEDDATRLYVQSLNR